MISGAIKRVKEVVENTELVRRVIFNDADEFLTFKTNFFPAVHIDVSEVTVDENAIVATFNVLAADTLDSKPEGFQEKENKLLEINDTTLAVLSRLISVMKNDSPDNEYQMIQEGEATLQRVFEQGTQDYYGWTCSFQVEMPNLAHND